MPTVNIRKICKDLPKGFAHSDKTVRSEANRLAIEIYKWIGKGLLPLLDSIKPIQLKELSDQIEILPSSRPVPERSLRSMESNVLAPEKDSSLDESSSTCGPIPDSCEDIAPEVDVFASSDPVDVLSKIPPTFEEMVSSVNWKERKEALDGLLPILKVPRLAEGRYGDLVSLLAKKISDTNINIVIVASQCVEAIALGLRSSFLPYQNVVLDPLLERCKEKKANVLDALRSALDAVFYAQLSLHTEFTSKFKKFLVHKNPQVKIEVIGWIYRGLLKLKTIPAKGDLYTLCEQLLSHGFDDGSTEVREAAYLAFSALLKIMDDKASGPFLEKIDKIKLTRIMELKESVVLSIRVKSPPSNLSRPVVSSTSGRRPVPSKPPSSTSLSARPALAKESSTSAVSSKETQQPKNYIPKYSMESAQSKVSEHISSSLLSRLSDANWKERLASIEEFKSLLASDAFCLSLDAESIVRFLVTKPSFKDSNFQVLQTMIDSLSSALTFPQYSTLDCRGSFEILLAESPILEKLTDIKLRPNIITLLGSVSEKKIGYASCLAVVLDAVQVNLDKMSKNFKLFAEICKVAATLITAHGSAPPSVVPIFALLRNAFASSNAMVKGEAISLLIVLRNALGTETEIRRFIEKDVPPNVRSTIESELLKSPICSIVVKKLISPAKATDGPKDSTFSLASYIPGLSSPEWKIRKAEIDKLKNNVRGVMISPSSLTDEFMIALKARFTDSNKNIILDALELVAELGASLSQSLDSLGKVLKSSNAASQFLYTMLLTLSDIKVQIRAACIKALDFLIAGDINRSSSPLISLLFEEMKNVMSACDSPFLKKECCLWMSKCAATLQPTHKPIGLKELLKGKEFVHELAKCLADRSIEVRKASQSLIQALTSEEGIDWRYSFTGLRDKFRDMGKVEAAAFVESLSRVDSVAAPKSNEESCLPIASEQALSTEGADTENDALSLELDNLDCPLNRDKTVPLNDPEPSSTATILDNIFRDMVSEDFEIALNAYRALSAYLPKPEEPAPKKQTSSDIRLYSSRIVESLIFRLEHYLFTELNPAILASFNNIPRSLKFAYSESKAVSPEEQSRLKLEKRLEVFSLITECCANLLLVFVDQYSTGLSIDGMSLKVDKKSLSQCLRVLIAALVMDNSYWTTECGSNDAYVEKSSQLTRQLNILLLKVLENANRDLLYACLLSKLETACSYIIERDTGDEPLDKSPFLISCFVNSTSREYAATRKQLAEVDFKFVELLMKCIWRLTRSIQDNVAGELISVKDLTRACNSFLLSASPFQWKQRVAQEKKLSDMPLRTIKTILHELSVSLTEEDLMSQVQKALGPDWDKSMVSGYLRFMIEKKKETAAPDLEPRSPQLTTVASSVPVHPAPQISLTKNPSSNPEDYQAKLSHIRSLFTNQANEASVATPSTPGRSVLTSGSIELPQLPLKDSTTSQAAPLLLEEKENLRASQELSNTGKEATPISVLSLKERLARIKGSE